MNGLKIKYEPKSITGLLVAGGMLFVGTGTIIENINLTEYGNLFLLLGLGAWVNYIIENNNSPKNRYKR